MSQGKVGDFLRNPFGQLSGAAVCNLQAARFRDFREAFRIRMINEGASAPIVDALLGRSESVIHDDDQVARLRQEFERYGPAA